jgi:SAM-dependent methyltransferase
MSWPYEVAERDHDIQNPVSAEKIRLLGDYLRLKPESRVLDIACGKGGPALILAAAYGCRVWGIELRPAFAADARSRAKATGLELLIDIQTADAAQLELEPEAWDAALCLGATFVWGTIADAARKLTPTVRRGGFVAIGEPYWRQWPLPAGADKKSYVPLEETVKRFEQAGLVTTGLIAASDDDWDRYRSLHWRAIEEWLAEESSHADAAEILARHHRFRSEALGYERALLGWVILVGRKP